MNDQVKHDTFVNLMEILEITDAVIEGTHALQALPFEALTKELWETIQIAQTPVRDVATVLKISLVQGSKIVDNDALMSHLDAAITAD